MKFDEEFHEIFSARYVYIFASDVPLQVVAPTVVETRARVDVCSFYFVIFLPR